MAYGRYPIVPRDRPEFQHFTPDPPISREYMKEWKSFATNSTKGLTSLKQLITSLLTWGNETIPLASTIFFSFIDGEASHFENFFKLDVFGAIFLHIFCCILRLGIEASNSKYLGELSWAKLLTKLFANLFLVLKPFRYIRGYFYRYKRAKRVGDHLRNKRPLARSDIEDVVDLTQKELTDSDYEETEVYIQAIPMALLQIYALFQNNESFNFCSRADIARLWFFVACILSGAKSVTDNESKYNLNIKARHFLYHFDTRHPINLVQTCMCTYPISFARNALFLLHRFYCISYFLAASDMLAGIYLVTIFFTQWIMLQLFPEVMRLPYENPPYGIHSKLSDLLDQWINLFCNHRTKLNWVTKKDYNICGIYFKIPLSLLQIIPFITSMAVVFTIADYVGDDWGSFQLFLSLQRKSGESIACMNYNETIPNLPEWAGFFVTFVENVHVDASNRFKSFKDIFGVIHFLPFSIYFYFLVSTMYNCYLNWYHLIDPMFPVQIGNKMWHSMIDAIFDRDYYKLCGTDPAFQLRRKLLDMRKLMILTRVGNSEFRQLYRKSYKSSCFKSEEKFAQFWNEKALEIVNYFWHETAPELVLSLTVPVLEANEGEKIARMLDQIVRREHPLQNDFEKIQKLITGHGDKKLFIMFYNQFENGMRDMTSHRAKATFEILDIPLSNYRF